MFALHNNILIVALVDGKTPLPEKIRQCDFGIDNAVVHGVTNTGIHKR